MGSGLNCRLPHSQSKASFIYSLHVCRLNEPSMIQLPLPSLISLGLSALSKMPEECSRAHLESQRGVTGVTGKTHPAQTSRPTVGLREPWSFLDAQPWWVYHVPPWA